MLRRDLSYSVYLVHGPLIQTLILLGLLADTLAWTAGIVAAVLLSAVVTERLIERPGTEFGRLLAHRLGRRTPLAPGVA
jgi:peptidoglycan/LPS O-acetylase OafA/YrhL